MDPASILHTYTKLVAEGRINSINTPVPECLPPPYTPAEDAEESDDDDDETDDLNLKINASTTIHGSNNLISIPQLDAPRLSAILVSALQHHAESQTLGSGGSMRAAKVNIEINCGISITGDRNVVGNVPVALRRRQQQGESIASPSSSTAEESPLSPDMQSTTAGATTGAKRKAEGDVDAEREARRVHVEVEDA